MGKYEKTIKSLDQVRKALEDRVDMIIKADSSLGKKFNRNYKKLLVTAPKDIGSH